MKPTSYVKVSNTKHIVNFHVLPGYLQEHNHEKYCKKSGCMHMVSIMVSVYISMFIMHVYIYAYMHMCTFACMYVRMHACTYVWVHVCMCVHMYIILCTWCMYVI